MDTGPIPSPNETKPQGSSLQRHFRLIVAGLIVFNLAGCLFLVTQAGVMRPRLATFFRTLTPTQACSQPVLIVGGRQFLIASFKLPADGNLALPAGKDDTAYWIENPNPNFIFALTPSDANLTLGARLKSGDVILVIWADCGVENFVVQSVKVGGFDQDDLLSSPPTGMTVILKPDDPSLDLVIHGVRPGTSVQPSPNPSEAVGPQVDLTFQETALTSDKQTLKVVVEVKNTGGAVQHVDTDDISIERADGTQRKPQSVQPGLPVDIQPGASQVFSLSFPNPGGNTVVFHFLDFSVDLYY